MTKRSFCKDETEFKLFLLVVCSVVRDSDFPAMAVVDSLKWLCDEYHQLVSKGLMGEYQSNNEDEIRKKKDFEALMSRVKLECRDLLEEDEFGNLRIKGSI